jgi:general secretion pathway protein A
MPAPEQARTPMREVAVYKRFFGLRESPFRVNPDPRYLYLTCQAQEALAALTYGIKNRRGFTLLTGEVGTGKTTLLNRLLDWLREEHAATAFVFNSKLDENQFLEYLMADFGIPCGQGGKSQRLLRLNQWLLDRYRSGGSTVLIVDEAQNCSSDVLEEIRLLTNLETSTEKLLQIVLSGQPELEEKLRSRELRQLRQRITLRCRTAPLTLEETYGYIAERLRVAASSTEPIFSKEAIEAIHLYTHGIPRVVNLLCEHSLINAYVDHLRPIPAHVVEEAARELELDEASTVGSAKPVAEAEDLLQDLSRALVQLRQNKTVRDLAHERKP